MGSLPGVCRNLPVPISLSRSEKKRSDGQTTAKHHLPTNDCRCFAATDARCCSNTTLVSVSVQDAASVAASTPGLTFHQHGFEIVKLHHNRDLLLWGLDGIDAVAQGVGADAQLVPAEGNTNTLGLPVAAVDAIRTALSPVLPSGAVGLSWWRSLLPSVFSLEGGA